jgi:hypothetical protein
MGEALAKRIASAFLNAASDSVKREHSKRTQPKYCSIRDLKNQSTEFSLIFDDSTSGLEVEVQAWANVARKDTTSRRGKAQLCHCLDPRQDGQGIYFSIPASGGGSARTLSTGASNESWSLLGAGKLSNQTLRLYVSVVLDQIQYIE